MNMSLHPLLLQPAAENHRIRSCNAASLQPLRAGVLVFLRDGYAQTAASETEFLDDIGIALALQILVKPHHADIRRAALNVNRNVRGLYPEISYTFF